MNRSSKSQNGILNTHGTYNLVVHMTNVPTEIGNNVIKNCHASSRNGSWINVNMYLLVARS